MTYGELHQVLFDMRARVISPRQFELRVEVPRSFVGIVSTLVHHRMPAGVVVTYAPLAWWRCWFKRQQFTEGKAAP